MNIEVKCENVTVIVAVDASAGFSKDGIIPWHYTEDFKHFKESTDGHVCIMGRKTYDDMARMMEERNVDYSESILSNRTCYVLSNTETVFKGAYHAKDMYEVLAKHPEEQVFILGGQKVFEQGLSYANRVLITTIDKEYECDKFFPVDYVTRNFGVDNKEKIETESGDTLYILDFKR